MEPPYKTWYGGSHFLKNGHITRISPNDVSNFFILMI